MKTQYYGSPEGTFFIMFDDIVTEKEAYIGYCWAETHVYLGYGNTAGVDRRPGGMLGRKPKITGNYRPVSEGVYEEARTEALRRMGAVSVARPACWLTIVDPVDRCVVVEQFNTEALATAEAA